MTDIDVDALEAAQDAFMKKIVVDGNGGLEFLDEALQSAIAAWNTRAQSAPAPDDVREAVARAIDPEAFKGWLTLYEHCVWAGDDAETAKHYADETHLPEMDRARSRADAAIAAYRKSNN